MTDSKKIKGIKHLSSLSEEEILEMGSTSFYLSLSLSLVIYDCYMAGLTQDDLKEAIDTLYEEISKQVKERAN